MERNRIRALLEDVAAGSTAVDSALKELARLPFVETGDARTGELDPDATGRFNEYEFERDATDDVGGGGGGGEDEGAGEGDADAGVQALAGATKEQAAQAAAQGLDRANNAAGDGDDDPMEDVEQPPKEPEELLPDLGTVRAVDDATPRGRRTSPRRAA